MRPQIPIRYRLLFPTLFFLAFLLACGGGSSEVSRPLPPTPSTPSFSITLSSDNLNITAGQGGKVKVTITPANGFFGPVTLAATGLPTGGTASFSSNPVAAGDSCDLLIWLAASTPISDVSVVINGTANTLHASRTLQLAIRTSDSSTPSNRSSYFYTEGPLRNAVYDSTHKLVFATNQSLNQIEVFSTDTRQRLTPIPLPQPHALDLAPDNSRLWVGTAEEYFYAIDTTTRQVVERVTPPRTDSFAAQTLVKDLAVTANGSLLLRLGEVGLTGEGLYQYFPASGRFVVHPGGITGARRLLRSKDGSKVLLGAYGAVILYDAATDTFLQNNSVTGASPLAAIRPDGQQIAIGANSDITFLDAQLNIVGQVTTSAESGRPIYSADGRYVYVPENISILRTVSSILVVDAQSFTIAGVIPDLYLSDETAPCNDICDWTPYGTTLLTSDDTGLLVGTTPSGLAFIESTPILKVGATKHSLGRASPLQGSPNEVTDVLITGYPTLEGAKIAVGPKWATVMSATSTSAEVLVPPSSTEGPVNLFAQFLDGWTALSPNGFSYGPQVNYIVPAGDRTSGGSTVSIIGYGFGSDKSSVSVSIGGRPAAIQDIVRVSSTVVPLFQIRATVPGGTPGLHDIVVTTPTGNVTVSKAFRYLQSVQDYSIPGTFIQILYDDRRKQVYLLDRSLGVIQVFSTASQKVQTSIPVSGSPMQMVLLPDGSRLALANWNDTVTLVDLDFPYSRTSINVAIPDDQFGRHPASIGASADGKLFVAFASTGYYLGSMRTVDLQSLAVNTITDVCPSDFCRVESSKDGGRVFFAQSSVSSGNVSSYDSATHTFTEERALQDYLDEIAAAGDGNRWMFNYNFLDASNTIASTTSISSFIVDNTPNGVYGRRLHDSGGLMYFPLTNGLHIYDTQTGHLLRSYAGMVPTTTSLHTIALDETGGTVFAITPTGLEIVTLDSVPLSIGHVDPSIIPASVPTELTIRGSGFSARTRVTLAGTDVTADFVDANTLRVMIPPLNAGITSIVVSNPDGEQFELNAAIRAN